jgi:hypothetical protein
MARKKKEGGKTERAGRPKEGREGMALAGRWRRTEMKHGESGRVANALKEDYEEEEEADEYCWAKKNGEKKWKGIERWK